MSLAGDNMKNNLLNKILFTSIHLEAILVSFWILFLDGIKHEYYENLDNNLKITVFSVQIIYFFRYIFTNFYLKKGTTLFHALKENSWFEPIFALIMFNLVHVGAAYATLVYSSKMNIGTYIAIVLYISGTLIVVISEYKRFVWKRNSENKGKLYTIGLFRYSMHINYFGEWLLLSSYSFIAFSGSYWFLLVVIIDFIDLYFMNIPNLDKYLAEKYKNEFEDYQLKTKKFVPFIL